MAKTLADMKARIAAEIFRGDLTAQITNAIADAIDAHAGDRFFFSEPSLATEPTFNTVIGQATYGDAALIDIKTLYNIDYLTYTQAGTRFDIIRRQPREIDIGNQNGQINGPPDEFAYVGRSISLYPTPDAVYPIFIMGFLNIDPPATDIEDNNVWMNEAERLIRCRAKWELATHVTRNAAMATAMSPDEDGGPGGKPGATFRAYQELKMQTNRVVSVGRVAAMPF